MMRPDRPGYSAPLGLGTPGGTSVFRPDWRKRAGL